MPSIIKADDGVISGKTGITTTADNSGTLEFQAISGIVEMDNVTGALALPKGTTAQRPATLITGMQRWNTTTGSIEVYDGAAWGSVGGGGPGSLQSVQTTGFTAVSGSVYACNTTSAAFTVTLPAAPTAGSYVILFDYARTFGTNNLTISPNGLKISGSTSNAVLTTNGASVSIIYVDATQGWLAYSSAFTSAVASYSASYLLVAGGGSGGYLNANNVGTAGGGAGGVLATTSVFIPGTAYTITIGAGGSGAGAGTNGVSSSISTVATAIGGGYGAGSAVGANSGGSGGGGGYGGSTGGSGTAGQGNAGGNNTNSGPYYPASGGGGAGAVGNNGSGAASGAGGIGVQSSISGTTTYYGGGGGGGVAGGSSQVGAGGLGGGATGATSSSVNNGTANTGGGGGGTGVPSSGGATNGGGNGGSGICIISYTGAQRGTGGTVTSSGGNTIHTFTSSGTYTA